MDLALKSLIDSLSVRRKNFEKKIYICNKVNLAKLEVWTTEPSADYSCNIPSRSLLHVSVLNRIKMKVQPQEFKPQTSGLAFQRYTIELKRPGPISAPTTRDQTESITMLEKKMLKKDSGVNT